MVIADPSETAKNGPELRQHSYLYFLPQETFNKNQDVSDPLMSRNGPGVQYATSPLLASKTPVWRSKFIVGSMAFGFALLAVRAAYVEVFNNDFFIHQGEVRFLRTLEMPMSRGRILDG